MLGLDLVKGLIIGGLVGILIGFGGGWEVHGWKVASDQKSAVEQTMKNDAASVTIARDLDAKVSANSLAIQLTQSQNVAWITNLVPPTPYAATAPLPKAIPKPVAAPKPTIRETLMRLLKHPLTPIQAPPRDASVDRPANFYNRDRRTR